MSIRTCKRCHFDKDVDQFPVDKRNPNWKNNICKKCNGIRSNKNNQKNKSHNKYNWRKRGINLEEAYLVYNLEKTCAICGSEEKLHLDHCHKNGNVRGMLCHKCNRALGFFNDDPKLLHKAAEYVKINSV